MIKSKTLTDAARGQDCTLEIAGVCNGDSATVVHCHYPHPIAGYKATDVSGGHGCDACHAVIDRRNNFPLSDEDREFYMRRSQAATIDRLVQMGILTVKGNKA